MDGTTHSRTAHAAAHQARSLETVQHQLRVRADLLVDQELADVRALVTRELDNLTELLVLHERAVAAKVLLERLQDTLDVEVVGEALHGRQTLATVTLLHADVHLAAADARVILGVRERVWRIQQCTQDTTDTMSILSHKQKRASMMRVCT